MASKLFTLEGARRAMVKASARTDATRAAADAADAAYTKALREYQDAVRAYLAAKEEAEK